MEFPYTYFEDEVRDGFFVPGSMKKCWAAQLEVLEDIDRVCKKNNIQYFADWGTMLGAVRHGGFIPWDDDMDICMKRDDYNKFFAIAQKELPAGYSTLSFHTDDCSEMLIRVLNSRGIRFDKPFLDKFHGFPYAVGIDIFPLDYIAPDPDADELRCNLFRIVVGTEQKMDEMNPEDLEKRLCDIEEICNVKIDRNKSIRRQLLGLAERLSSMYKENESNEITQMPLWIAKGIYKFPKEYFQDSIMMPFENTQIPVPAAYDSILTLKYKDYMKPVKAKGGHDYPFYKKQDPALEEALGRPLMRYLFSPEILKSEERYEKKTVKAQAEKFLTLLVRIHEEIFNLLEQGKVESVLGLLEHCQQDAIQIGTAIEKVLGEGFVTVGLLEKYCEMVYQVHQKIVQDAITDLQEVYQEFQKILEEIEKSVQQDIKERSVAVFFPYKASKWEFFESAWKKVNEDPEFDVYVVPIPYYEKNLDGTLGEMHFDMEKYPEYVSVTDYRDFDIGMYCPDIIFIQNPYDEFNFSTSVLPSFYSKNLKKFTKQLIYIPCFVVDEIAPDDERSIISMEYYCIVPGVVNADRVIVQSENMRQAYIKALTKWAGEDTRAVWEEKIFGQGFDRQQG